MSNANERRESKLSKRLAQLARTNPFQFKQEWRKLLDAWSAEAYRRGNLLRKENAEKSSALPVYGVLDKAKRLLDLCGEDAKQLVGAVTRDLLEHDCGKAFAQAVEPHLYWLVNADRNYHLMKAGTHRPPR
jgi:hypothetical protein